MTTDKPNIVLILNDDMGYSDIGCYGGEVDTPNLDRLAAQGLRFSQFYNTARCSPSRASLLTGLHPHQTGVGILTYDSGPEGYAGNLNQRCVTIPQALKGNGYKTYMSGKWHVSSNLTEPTDSWPLQRGFDRLLRHDHRRGQLLRPEHADARQRQHRTRGARRGLLLHRRDQRPGGGLHRAASPRGPRPTLLHLRGLHGAALATACARRRHRQVQGPLRQGLGRAARRAAEPARRLRPTERRVEADRARPERNRRGAKPRSRRSSRAWTLRCMEVYAAQIDRMDQGIGRIVAALDEGGQLDNTLIIFLSDNGACAEDIPEDVGVDELVNKLMIARAKTRSGEPVHFGNDTGPHARAREHLPELRHRVGEPVEHAVSALQTLDPRRRHLDAADRALAERHPRAGAASAMRPATCPTSWPPSST